MFKTIATSALVATAIACDEEAALFCLAVLEEEFGEVTEEIAWACAEETGCEDELAYMLYGISLKGEKEKTDGDAAKGDKTKGADKAKVVNGASMSAAISALAIGTLTAALF